MPCSGVILSLQTKTDDGIQWVKTMTTRNMNRQPIMKLEPPTQQPTINVDRTKAPLLPIIIDTREQHHWNFYEDEDKATTTRCKLDTGDYSVRGYENKICVERKSLIDWVNTIVNNHNRFHVELLRMRDYDRSFVIIEGSVDDIMHKKYETPAIKRNISPETIIKMSIGIMMKYPWVQVVLADNRYSAKIVALNILRQYWKAHEAAK